MIWCEKVAKIISYALIHIYVPFFLKNDHYLDQSDGTTSHGYDWAVVRWHVSQYMTHPWIQLRCLQRGDVGSISGDIVGVVATRADMLPTFPTKLPSKTTAGKLLYKKLDCLRFHTKSGRNLHSISLCQLHKHTKLCRIYTVSFFHNEAYLLLPGFSLHFYIQIYS